MNLQIITGTICYNPVAYAVGDRRTARLRPYIPELFEILSNHPETKRNPSIQFWMREKKKDPEIFTRTGPQAVTSIAIRVIYNIALEKGLSSTKNILKRIEESLVITTKRNNWAIASVPYSIIEKAREEILHSHGRKPAISSWGPHVTVIRGEHQIDTEILNNKSVEITIDTEIKEGNGGYFFYNAISKDLEDLRIKQGLPKTPTPDFHLTIGCIT